MDESMGDISLDSQTLAGIKLMASSAPPPNVNAQFDEDRVTRRSVTNSPPPHSPPSTVPAANARYPINNTTRRAQGLVGHVIPRLTSSRTDPTKPSTRYISQPKMYNSFSAFDDGGDTQVIDSQIYRAFRGALTAQQDQSQEACKEPHAVRNGKREAEDTLEEGDSGHVDLIGDWHHGSERGEQMQMSGDEDIGSTNPETQMFAVPVSNAQFILPETPALSKKRNHRGEIVSSDMKTPGVEKLFNNGSGAPMLSLGEMFRQTPAASSPHLDGPRSDPMFSRPSPNLHMRFSSPSANSSSPTKILQSDATRAATEPRETYMTMKESQELRDRTMRARFELQRQQSNEITDVFTEWLMTDDGKAAERDLQGSFAADAVVTSTRMPRPGRRGRATMSDTALMTPARSLARVRDVVNISDDVAEDLSDDYSLDGITMEPPTVQKPPNNLAGSTTEVVQIPMTSSRPRETSLDEPSGQRQPSQSNGGHELVPECDQEDPAEYHIGSSNMRSFHGTQNIAVADSQPSAGNFNARGGGPPPRLPDPSSIESNVRITQSQYSTKSLNTRTNASGRFRDALDTSSVPRPPNADEEQKDDEEQLPSSPPLAPPPFDVPDAGEDCPDTEEHIDLVGSDDNYDKPDLEQSETYSSPSRTPAQRLSQYSVPAAAPNHHFGRIEADKQAVLDAVAVVEHASPQRQDSKKPKADMPLDTFPGPHDGESNHANDSNEPRLFSTARTHISNSESPKKSQQASKAKSSQKTPGSTRIRRLRDIAAEPSQNRSHDEVDLDLDILTEDDHFFAAVTADKSPTRPSKRRKVYTARTPLCEQHTEIDQLPSASTIPEQAKTREEVDADAAKEARPATKLKETPNAKPGKLSHPSSKLQNRTVFAAKESSQSPELDTAEPHVETPPIKKTPRKKQSDQLSANRTIASPKVAKPQTPARNKTTLKIRPTPVQQAIVQPSSSAIPAAELTDEVVYPNRILALFKGTNMAYYPATCLGSFEDSEGVRLKVRFDDGTITSLEPSKVLSLDLRIDDLVKVDLPKLRSKTYIVRELKDKVNPRAELTSEDAFLLTDAYGHQTVRLETKRRESLPARGSVAEPEIIEVSLASIYITSVMSARFKGRTYTPRIQLSSVTTRLQTPSSVAPDTPHSKARSRILPGLGSSIRRTASTGSIRVSELLSGMAFAVTFTDPDERATVTNLIISHGGRILEPGFDVLFDIHGQDIVSPTKTPQTGRTPQLKANNNNGRVIPNSSSAPTSEVSDDHCTLKPDAENLGFTALISDSHSRRAKYMQALALGLPCLSARWIRDCIDSSRVLPWPRYLLPAGESAYLGGVVRSRTLAPYDPVSARLADVIMRRERLLRDFSVLLVMGKGKVKERRNAYVFLTHALGAKRVERVKDVDEAKKVLDRAEKGEWDWLYLDGMEAKAERVLFGGTDDTDELTGEGGGVTVSKGKGKKNWNEGLEVRRTRLGVKVVSDEFVIQSLILGALMDEEE